MPKFRISQEITDRAIMQFCQFESNHHEVTRLSSIESQPKKVVVIVIVVFVVFVVVIILVTKP